MLARETARRSVLHEALDFWASRTPDEPAIRNATRGTVMSFAELALQSRIAAAGLARLGFRKGDVLAASLPLLNEHIVLEYACFRLGVIHAPLDLRLQPAEVIRCCKLMSPKGYAFLGKALGTDFGGLGLAVKQHCASVEQLIQFVAPSDCVEGAVSFGALMASGADAGAPAEVRVSPHDAAQVIFTTGSTGSPKGALLSHEGIVCQNLCLGTAFGFGPGQRTLCNLPASHVGGQAELLLTSLFCGGAAVTLEVFDPVKSLDAIEQCGVTLIGQIPAMFQMEWRTPGYGGRDLRSVRAAVYGGQSVQRPFLNRMLEMAPTAGTGLGLTEASGFCTYTELTDNADRVARSIGWAMPAYPVSIRNAVHGDGRAGEECPTGEIGHVCFRGPQNFLKYVNDPAATAAVLSSDGWMYTGDMGRLDEEGLHFSGRAKWILKPRGYQVFPGDVEDHFAQLEGQVANVGVVGHEHRIWSEGVIAFIEKRPGAELTAVDLRKHARSLTSYMRPLHYVVLDAGAMPLNRSAKVDVVRLQEMAREEVARLRERGRWDGDLAEGTTAE
jgi:acyl-CoA synthetase (AMP-forming)/AMP-acid ligase II